MITEIEILVTSSKGQLSITIDSDSVTLYELKKSHPYLATRLWDIMSYLELQNESKKQDRTFTTAEDF